MRQKTVSIQLDCDLISYIEECAQKEGLSKSAVIRRLIIYDKCEREKNKSKKEKIS